MIVGHAPSLAVTIRTPVASGAGTTMLTLFTCAKAFRGHIGVIQRNALNTWLRLEPKPEIILFGDDPGAAETAREMGLRHVPHVAVNEYGTPLIGDIFEQGQKLASNRLVCYVNADIILLPDFLRALAFVASVKQTFLMVGKRRNVDITEPIDFDAPDWRERLGQTGQRDGMLGAPNAIDYFAFPKGALGPIPPFALGRMAWDNWLLFRARQRNMALVDATGVVDCLHQNHDYAHVKQGATTCDWTWPEAQTNVRLAGGPGAIYSLDDATHALVAESGSFAIKSLYSFRHMQRSGYSFYHMNPVIGAARAAARAARGLVRGAGDAKRS